MKKTILLFALLLTVGMANATDKLYATFGSLPGGAPATLYKYSWTATTNNLMPLFEFSAGELANYKTLKFTLSNLTGGMVRMGYYVGSAFTEFGSGYGSSSEKTVDLKALGIDLSTVDKISFGGRTGTGSVNISNVYLIPASSGDNLNGTYGSLPGGANATFYDYDWTGASNNLWPCFTFSAGELANYTTLKFTLSLAAGSAMVRMGYYVGSDFTEFGSGFGSSGEKTVDLVALGIDLSTVNKISFGGRSGTGSANLRNVYLDNEATNRTFTPGQYSTVCLPFALTAEEAAAAGTFYELSTCDGTTVKFTEVSGATAAYTPYVFKAASADPFAALDKSCVYPVVSCTATVGSATFTGVLKDGKAPNGVYGFQSDKFVKTTSDDVSIKAFRAYLTVAAGANELTAVFGNESTGIRNLTPAVSQGEKVVYDLQGRRVAQPTKGLYIINGRKVVLK